MAPDGELALLYFVVPSAPGRSRLMSLPLATSPKFRCSLPAAAARGLAPAAWWLGAGVPCLESTRLPPLLPCCRGPAKLFHWQPWLRHLYNVTDHPGPLAASIACAASGPC